MEKEVKTTSKKVTEWEEATHEKKELTGLSLQRYKKTKTLCNVADEKLEIRWTKFVDSGNHKQEFAIVIVDGNSVSDYMKIKRQKLIKGTSPLDFLYDCDYEFSADDIRVITEKLRNKLDDKQNYIDATEMNIDQIYDGILIYIKEIHGETNEEYYDFDRDDFKKCLDLIGCENELAVKKKLKENGVLITNPQRYDFTKSVKIPGTLETPERTERKRVIRIKILN